MHTHVWLRNTSTGRFTCSAPGCGVQGHAPTIIAGQHRGAESGVVAYTCRHMSGNKATGRKACGAEAVVVGGDRQQSRCGEHAPISAERSA